MKLIIAEHKHGMELSLTPETVEEMSQLLRFSMNAAAEKPEVSMSFSGEPYCWIFMKKRKQSVQKNFVSPNSK